MCTSKLSVSLQQGLCSHVKVHWLSKHTLAKTPWVHETRAGKHARKEHLKPKAPHVHVPPLIELRSTSNPHQTALWFMSLFRAEVPSSCQSQHFPHQGQWKSPTCDVQQNMSSECSTTGSRAQHLATGTHTCIYSHTHIHLVYFKAITWLYHIKTVIYNIVETISMLMMQSFIIMPKTALVA